MTTDKHPIRAITGGSVIMGAVGASAAVGLVTVVVAGLVAGSPALLGAAIGAAMVVLFFGAGALLLNAVASSMPAASLLVALLTYTLEVLLVGVVFVVLRNSGLLDETIAPGWLAGTVIGCTLAWMIAQIYGAMRVRQPVYDLPSHEEEAGAR